MSDSITLPHPADDLRGKRIRFRLRVPIGDPPQDRSADGTGILLIDDADDGGFIATIRVWTSPDHPLGIGVHEGYDFELSQEVADTLRFVPKEESGVELECVDPSLPLVD